MASRKKHSQPPARPSLTVRFEATLGSTPHARALMAAAELDLDRLPDADGKVRLLLSPDDARRLLEAGFEVHLTAAARLAPLDPALVISDSEAASSLEQRVKSLRRKGGR